MSHNELLYNIENIVLVHKNSDPVATREQWNEFLITELKSACTLLFYSDGTEVSK